MTQTARIGGSRALDQERGQDARNVEARRRVAEWGRALGRASGGRLTRSALQSSATALDVDDVAALASLERAEVRGALADALGSADADRVDEVCTWLAESVGNVVRAEVRQTAERAIARKLGELRAARDSGNERAVARVLSAVAEEADPEARELALAGLGVADVRDTARTIRSPAVRSALLGGHVPAALQGAANQLRASLEETIATFGSAYRSAASQEQSPFRFGRALERTLEVLGTPRDSSFLGEAITRSRDEDARHERVVGLTGICVGVAARIAVGPFGEVASVAHVAEAQENAKVQLAGFVAGVSTQEDARDAAIDAEAATTGAAAGAVVGIAAHRVLPHTWIGRAVETVWATGTEHLVAETTRRER